MTITLKELNELQKENHDIRIEYCDHSEPDDLFVEVEMVSTDNDQFLITAYVPQDLAEKLEDEVQLTPTSQYHKWTSFLTEQEESLNRRLEDADEEDKEEIIADFIEEYNNEEIGKKYPITREEIDLMEYGASIDDQTHKLKI